MRTFFILGEITNNTLEVLKEIQEHKESVIYEDDNDRDIRVVICSEGGSEDVGYAIYDTLMAYRKFGKVYTFGYGQVCSIATLILQAGDVRGMSPNCMLMVHNGSLEVDKPIDDKMLKDIIAFFDKNNKRYYSVMAKHSKTTIDKIREWCNSETYFTAEQAVKAKLADKITKDL